MLILNRSSHCICQENQMGSYMGSFIGPEITCRTIFFLSMAFPLEHCNRADLKCLKTKEKTTSQQELKKIFVSYLVSFVPICCLSSSLSSSVCMGRMFFSSSSRLEGLLLSLIAKESFLQSFLARGPVGERKGSAKGGIFISLQHAAGKEVLAKGGYEALVYTGMDYGKRGVINFMCSINLNSYHNKEKLKLVGIQEIEINILLHRGDWRRRACFRIANGICSLL